MADLAGQAVLVTGAQQGIGKAIAIALAREGADLAINYLNDKPAAEDVAAAVRAAGCKAVLVSGDISAAATTGALVDATVSLCGFTIAFDRLHEGFAYLDLDGAQVMLEERGRNRNWIAGLMEAPFGRGVNFQIGVKAIDPILAVLDVANWPLFMEPKEK